MNQNELAPILITLLVAAGGLCVGYLFGARRELSWKLRWIAVEYDLAFLQKRAARTTSNPDAKIPDIMEMTKPEFMKTNLVQLFPEARIIDMNPRMQEILLTLQRNNALTGMDNRKLIWLAMAVWKDQFPWDNRSAADIFDEIRSRLYPEYDNETVTFESWGWKTPQGDIRYLMNPQHADQHAQKET
jgi:hypothetical protein